MIDKRLLNVSLLGIAFMLIFVAFQTLGNIEQTMLESMKKENPTFKSSGYISLSIIYVSFAFCNWLVPSAISVMGPKLTMFTGGLIYALFISLFLVMAPTTWLFYLGSALVGLGAAFLWTGQGTYLTINSDASTISRNSGIFWALLQSNMFWGNLFVTFAFSGKTEIDPETRTLVVSVLSVVCVLGVAMLLALPAALAKDGTLVPTVEAAPLKALRGAFALFATKDILLLCFTFLYLGFEQSFFIGVYGSCIGFTQQLGSSAKTLVGISGIFIGAGEVVGGVAFGLLGSKTVRWGRNPIVLLGLVGHIVAFVVIFLNLPNSAPFGDTVDKAILNSSAVLAILCSFLLGLGDSCFNTQILSILGGMYPTNSAPAFAIFKFSQSLASAASFFYSTKMGLQVQLYILAAWGVIGTITFCLVEGWNKPVEKRNVMESQEEEKSRDP